MAEIKWVEIDKKTGSQNFVDAKKEHYIIMQLDPDKFGVVWLMSPNAFINFCKTPDDAKAFCESHKKYFSGLYVSDKSAIDDKSSVDKIAQ